ncbi:required for meiotic nuclear division protein 1 homolog [Schistocerca cancellata]|uniref:required for meiotic nuclear division protein 1 homolog n=1 Tax=Schistocerca cancellata TaxID=274614 RepID=UPI0021188770|nr:required for meiotic nuclear division protein 1 homolog [Schistocerca cancellata]
MKVMLQHLVLRGRIAFCPYSNVFRCNRFFSEAKRNTTVHSVIGQTHVQNYAIFSRNLRLLCRPPEKIKDIVIRSESTKSMHDPQGIHESFSALQTKKLVPRKKRTAVEEKGVSKPGFWNVVAYATAEEYELEKLREGLIQQDLYEVRPLGDGTDTNQAEPDVLQVTARYTVGSEPRDIFFFREGTTVFWNVSELECTNVLSFVKPYEENSYDERLVNQESELMEYTYIDVGHSRLSNGNLCLSSKETTYLDKYTFSNAMALSVKLGIWEASLSRYVDTIEFVTEDMKQGRKIRMSRKEVLRKTGELFALRHLINLSSDLLDTPDFYWDRETQEALYQQMCSYFSISRRTRVMNEKLNHCFELVELLSSHLNDQHHTRLEWMIIALIMIEVIFEILHYIEKLS